MSSCCNLFLPSPSLLSAGAADGDIRWQIAYTDNHCVPFSSASNACPVRACQTREMNRETGLEAGDAIFGK